MDTPVLADKEKLMFIISVCRLVDLSKAMTDRDGWQASKESLQLACLDDDFYILIKLRNFHAFT